MKKRVQGFYVELTERSPVKELRPSLPSIYNEETCYLQSLLLWVLFVNV